MGYAVYLSLDALTYFDQTGIYKFKEGARIQKEAYRAWFVGLACNIVAGVYTLYNLQQVARQGTDESPAAGGDAEKKVEQKTLERYVSRFSLTPSRLTNMFDVGRKLPLNCSSFRMFAILRCQEAQLALLDSTRVSLDWQALSAV